MMQYAVGLLEHLCYGRLVFDNFLLIISLYENVYSVTERRNGV